MAYVTIEPERLSDLIDRNPSLRMLEAWKKNPERTLSIIQVGITFVGGLAAVVGGAEATESFMPVLMKRYGLSMGIAEFLAIVMVILPLTYLNVVIGELAPKAIALRTPEKILTWVYPFIFAMDKLLSPVVSALEASTDFFLRHLDLRKTTARDGPPKKVHIENLDDYHQRYVLNLVGLKGKKNRDVLVPWSRAVTIDYGESDEEVEAKITYCRHTRLPVMDHGQVIGLLHTKEFQSIPEDRIMPWQGLMRPILKVKPEEKVLITFNKMQSTQNHMAIVQDDDEHIHGIVTMENIIEQILGSIDDEDDDDRLHHLMNRHRGASLGRNFWQS